MVPSKPIAEVFVDEQCTSRPIKGNTYRTLYVRLYVDQKPYEALTWGTPSEPGKYLSLTAPEEGEPDPTYEVSLYFDMASESYPEPFRNGDVVKVDAYGDEPILIGEDYIFVFE